MKTSLTKTDLLLYVLTLLIVIGGVLFWAYNLTSDPPSYFSGKGQSLATDPAQYVHHARNKILYDDWDPFDYPRWIVYEHSLTSGVAYLWFQVVGVSLKQAAAVGVILSLSGLALLLLGLVGHHHRWTLPAVTVWYLVNATLFTYGRLSYLENGLLLISSAFCCVYIRWGHKTIGVIAAGSLAAAAAVTGKLFGALLLPALLLALLFEQKERRFRNLAAAASAFVVTGLALTLVLYGDNLAAVLAYVGEQSYGLRGFPAGLSSPWAFIEHLISYGYTIRLYYNNPDLLIFPAAAAVLLILLSRDDDAVAWPRAMRLSLFWMIVGIVGLMPLNYSPVRYCLFFIPAIILFAITTFDYLRQRPRWSMTAPDNRRSVLLCLVLWVLIFQGVANVFFFGSSSPPIRPLTWSALLAAVGVTLALRFFIRRRRPSLSRGSITTVLVFLLCSSVTWNIIHIRHQHFLRTNYNIMETNRDLEQILAPGAVVSGPYGPVMTLDTPIKSFIHLFGVARVDSSLFDRFPVTHVAVDVSNTKEAVETYPQIGELRPTATYIIRDIEVKLYNISKQFANPRARAYRESHYERAVAHYFADDIDSAIGEMNLFIQTNPDSKAGGLLLGDLLWKKKRYGDVLVQMDAMTKRFPTDYWILVQAGRFHQIVGIMTRDNGLLVKARHYYDQAAWVNPFRSEEIKAAHDEIRDRMHSAAP